MLRIGLGESEIASRFSGGSPGGGVNCGWNPPALKTKPKAAAGAGGAPAHLEEQPYRGGTALNPTSPVVRSMVPSKSACRSMIGRSGSGIAILNSPMMTILRGVRERQEDSDRHRDKRIRSPQAELQDRADGVLAQPRREDRGDLVQDLVRAGHQIVGDEHVGGAAGLDEGRQRTIVDGAIEAENPTDRVERRPQEDLDRRAEFDRHDDHERHLAVDLVDDSKRLDREIERPQDEAEFECAGDLVVAHPEKSTALDDRRVDLDTDTRRFNETRRSEVDDAEVPRAVGRQPQRLRNPQSFHRDRQRTEFDDDGSRRADREARAGNREGCDQAVNGESRQSDDVRPRHAETDPAVEVEAARIEAQQQLAFQ